MSQSAFPWEREALEFARTNLPDNEPWRAWSNLEFIDDEGRVNEVDLLVLTPAGLILIEIKSRPGTVRGDAQSWTWTTDGRAYVTDNPLLLANRKAKRLATLLRRQEALNGKGAYRPAAPWVEPLIWLSHVKEQPRIDQGSALRVALAGRAGEVDGPGLVGILSRAEELGLGRRGPIDSAAVRSITRAIEQAGIRAPSRGRRVGDYELEKLLTEGETWQDFAARHVATGVGRRIRVYPFARAATAEAREKLVRMAQREFRVLEGVEHPGIQRVLDYREAELGPALVFEHDPASVRLDRYLIEHQQSLPLVARLGLVRQLADAMAFAHSKRLFHRGLAPQNILVRDANGDIPRLQITNWEVARREEGSQSGAPMTAGTMHVEEHLSDPAKLYLAPEAAYGIEDGAAQADVFSLGATAYFIFSAKPPADSAFDLPARLREGEGLRLSSAVNGVGGYLEELVRAATAPAVSSRLRDAREFLEYLSLAENEARPPDPEPEVQADPATAMQDDLLDGGLKVIRRLGRGGSADVLLVARADSDDECVLKVAIDGAHADRVQAEAEILKKIRHQNIVKFEDAVTVSGRPGILMEQAGDRTLAQWIRGAETLSLDLMRRFGDQLLSALDYLEAEGVAHRDLKPDNIGIAKSPSSGAYRLVLFDFSLSRAPAENIQAGTRPYLDPFLIDRRPPRWDLHAERYAAAVTLHEMLTGAAPVFGDGLSEPSLIEDEATVAVERFDPALRDGLHAFFERALKRDAAARFGNAEEMLRAWGQAFMPLSHRGEAPESIEVIARRLHGGSSMADVGYGVEARDVLQRMQIHTVSQLLGADRFKFRYLKGVGERIRVEIRLRAKDLARLRPELVPGTASQEANGRASVDRLAEQLVARRPAGDEKPEDRILARYLGLEPEDAAAWPDAGDVALAATAPRSSVAAAVEAARTRWHKSGDLNALREDLQSLLQDLGGVASLDEMSERLLAVRGSAQEEGPERNRRARAVIRAAVELEASMAAIRFAAYADEKPVLISTSPENTEYARRLGRAADGLTKLDPLPSPSIVESELGVVPMPEGAQPLPPSRRLRLAVAASKEAALSFNLEVYPKGLPALSALRMSLGALIGPQMLTEHEIRARIRGRFPQAEELPPRPELDQLLTEAGAEREWRDASGNAPGFYSLSVSDSDSGTQGWRRLATTSPAAEATPEVLDARALEEKIAHAASTGAFLALSVDPRRTQDAQAEILRRFPRQVVSLERLMLRAMREEATARRVLWPKALAADAAPADSTDFRHLLSLAARAAPRLKSEILALREPALLTCPGLLARYDLLDVLEGFAQASGASGGPPSLWLLLPQSAAGRPQIDGVVLPVISGANWARLTDPWVDNRHRAGQRAA